MKFISALMKAISRMFQFLVQKKATPPPAYYLGQPSTANSGYTAPVGAKILKG